MLSFGDFLEISEASGFKFKVRANGKKRKKRVCPPGSKPSPSGSSCRPMKSKEKRNRKLGSRKTQRKIRAGGPALKRRADRKRKKALRFRKAFGLRNSK